MVFSSIPFLFFFIPLFLISYYIAPLKYKNGVILVFSLIFYAWGEPVYIILMILETLSDYLIGLKMEKTDDGKKRKFLLITSLVIDLSALGFFKYADFVIGTINSVFSCSIPKLELALPVGISFFTFQSLSYVIDLYWGDVEAEHSYADYLTYISMFPQLIAGPIVRFSTIREELHNRRENSGFLSDSFCEGFLRFLRGLFKKVLLANQIGSLYDEINSISTSASVCTMWLGAIAFTFQIYFDFSGYSDMAIGMGRMMGFSFPENFDYPLISESVTEFWRRWHMTLSGWFRRYVYIPLGGNRVSRIKHIRNIMIVWMLTGLWHGASWNFVIWGLYYGILLLLEKLLYGKYLEKLPRILRRMYSYVCVCLGFVIFSHDVLTDMIYYLKGMFGLVGNSLTGSELIWYLKDNAVIIIACFIFMRPHKELKSRLLGYLRPIAYLALFALCIASLVNDSYNPFLYFRF